MKPSKETSEKILKNKYIKDKTLSNNKNTKKMTTKKPQERKMKKYPKKIWDDIDNALQSYNDTQAESKEGGQYDLKKLKEFEKTADELYENKRYKLPFNKLTPIEKETIKVVLESERLSLDYDDDKDLKKIHNRVKKIIDLIPTGLEK